MRTGDTLSRHRTSGYRGVVTLGSEDLDGCLLQLHHSVLPCLRRSIRCLAISIPFASDLKRHAEPSELIGVTMAEERIPSSVGDENQEPEKKELAKDRKSLTGMSEKVKATLAPLLGGIKHHPEVEGDLGREAGAATYETVPTGSTPMSRYSAVAEATTDPNPNLLAPFQDVGLEHSSNVVRESGRGRPGHKPNEDQFVLDGNSDPVHQFRSTTPTSEGENPFNG